MDVKRSCLVTVSCASFSQYVAIALRNLFHSRRGTDLSFNWEGNTARAHRIILELFLATETMDCNVGELPETIGIKQEVPDCDGACGSNVLEALLEFLYKGEVTVPEGQVKDLLRASKELGFKMLEGALVQSCSSKALEFENGVHIKEENFKERLVTVTYDNYDQYVAIALRNLFDSRRGTDFDLKWEGLSIRAHRIIMELFLSTETMGQVNCPVGIKQEVPDCDDASGNNVLESLLEFLYRGEVTVPEEQLADLLRASKELDFKMLEDSIVEFCNSNVVEVETVLDVKEEFTPGCSDDISLGTRISTEGDSPAMTFGAGYLEIAPPGGPKVYSCSHCEFKTVAARSYRRHLLKSHGTNTKGEPAPMHRCSHCPYETSILSDYRQHLLRSHEMNTKGEATPKQKCPHCEFETTNFDIYRRHLVKSHGMNTKGEPAPKRKCPHCEFETSDDNCYGRHMLKSHGMNAKGKPPPKQKCPHCEFETSMFDNYRQHLVRSHGMTTKGAPALKRKCPHCEYETSMFDNYRQHLLRTHGMNTKGELTSKHKCPHCEFEASIYDNYRRHLGKRHGMNTKGETLLKHKCQHCDFEATVYHKYCNHLSVVHGVTLSPIHKCALCEFETSSGSDYSHHSVSVHGKAIQEVPAPIHKCPECDFSTAFVSRLNRHTASHSKDNSHYCEHCGYAGKTKAGLARHLRISHGENSSIVTCEICGMRCLTRSGLERHILIHSTEPQFKCPHCVFASNYKNSLSVHLRNKHS